MTTNTEYRTQKTLTQAVKGAIIGLMVPMSITGTMVMCYQPSIIPRARHVQEGFIAPSRLEIKCYDKDGNGMPETFLQVDGRSYFLRENSGKPILSACEVEPAKEQYK